MDRKAFQRRETDRDDQESHILKLHPVFNLPEIYVGPGEFASSAEDVVISTLLGSCISVALYEVAKQLGGLNHFLLPVPKNPSPDPLSEEARYGVNAMELLVNDLLRKGARREALRAKVFGGSSMIDLGREATYDVPRMNIRFVFDFLERERVPVDAYSVGGERPRRVYFFPRTAKVLMRFSDRGGRAVGGRDSRYSHELQESFGNAGRPILF